ncbi:hypothetical protein J6836_22570 (plasmid) [Providencia sp. R33]|uniref:hypothetical protein n=1 Tax=Providencia sp. R33 TaxID=2828763 RepID=UPI001C5AFF42|nr:hypothetical protein [Providencia sp. R33]QXX85142.1 hypothetical protein J6836_22570 [Providencia sp. R33]
MSIHDPIDLDAIKQAVFRENLPNFLNHAYFWMITDQDNHVLSCSSHENVNSILNSIKIPPKSDKFIFPSIELVPLPHSNIAISLEVNCFKMIINSQIVFLRMYNFIRNTNIKFRIFYSDLFTRKDKFDNKLYFSDSINRLQHTTPWITFTEHEWTVGWLIIHRLTNKEIAKITNKNIYTINDTVSRILGMYKLDLYDRYLLSDVGLYLYWDCYVPLSLLKDTV